MIAYNKEPENSPGGGGALFQRSDNLRSDARMAAKLISLGVVSLEQAESLLRAGFTLAAQAAQKKDCRGYSACMRIAIEVAKLELSIAENQRQQPATESPAVVILDWRRNESVPESN